jgi:hypothetical protein
MSRVEDEITRQLHLCACLMSDPQIMREQSVYVADQFVTAMNKIEQLQQYLRPPDDPCARHNWIDNTVLTVGVRRMVWLALGKHMEPLRWKTAAQLRHAVLKGDQVVEGSRNAAPKVFTRGFDEEKWVGRHGETPIAREIKETNCMASIVLLYYYLNWHVLLLLLNHINHGCVSGRDHVLKIDLDRLFRGLPGFADTFEFRVIKSFLHKNHMNGESSEGGNETNIESWSSDEDSETYSDDDDDGRPENAEESIEADSDNAGGKEQIDKSVGAQGQERGNSFAKIVGEYRSAVDEKIQEMSGAQCFSEFLSSLGKADVGLTPGSDRDVGKKRKGGLMDIYRMTLCLTHHADTPDHVLNNAFVSCYVSEPKELVGESKKLLEQHKLRESIMLTHTEKIIQARAYSLLMETKFNMGAYSVYNAQEDTQRWFDMYRQFDIKSVIDDAGAEFGQQKAEKKYTTVLANVLNSSPYSKIFFNDVTTALNLKDTKRLCIHDFNNASMMMDIVRSYLKLHDLIVALMDRGTHGNDIKKKIIIFMTQTYASDKTLSKFLNSTPSLDGYESTHPLVDSEWLSVPIGNHKKVVSLTETTFGTLAVDEIAGYYWGSSVSNHETMNHRYLAWPRVESSGYKQVMKVVVFLLKAFPKSNTESFLILESSLRNSLFVQSIGTSILELMDRLECTAFFDDASVIIESNDTIHGPGLTFKYAGDVKTEPSKKGAAEPVAKEPVGDGSSNGDEDVVPPHLENKILLFKTLSKKSHKSKMNKSKLVSQLRSEMASLKYRVSEVERGAFKLYCGTSWPVTGLADNLSVFGKGVLMPRMLSDRMTNATEWNAFLHYKQNNP